MRSAYLVSQLGLLLAFAQNAHYTLGRHFFVGSPAQEVPYAALRTADGRLIIAGEFQDSPQTLSDGWIVCVSPEGDVLWQSRPGGL